MAPSSRFLQQRGSNFFIERGIRSTQQEQTDRLVECRLDLSAKVNYITVTFVSLSRREAGIKFEGPYKAGSFINFRPLLLFPVVSGMEETVWQEEPLRGK